MPVERITVKIKMKPYIKAFLISVYGKEPVYFPKKDKLNSLIYFLLSKQPPGYVTEKLELHEYLEVILPYYEDRNINVYFHLSKRSQQIIEKRARELFFITFNAFMDECFRLNLTRADSISMFIEKYDLPFNSGLDDLLKKEQYRSKRILQKWPVRSYIHSK